MKQKINISDWVVVVVGILFIVRGSEAVIRLFKAEDQVKEARNQLIEAKKLNEELRERLEEVNSPEFVEREARDKLGYGREGEIILLLPELENDKDKPTKEEKTPNWKLWWDLYIRI